MLLFQTIIQQVIPTSTIPASTTDPVSSVLKNAFAFNASGRDQKRSMHSVGTGLIQGISSSSLLSNNDLLDKPSSDYTHNGDTKPHDAKISVSSNSNTTESPVLENSIRANAKKLLLSAQECNVEFDEPTRHVSGMFSEQASSNNVPGANLTQKSKIIVLNPQYKKFQVICFVIN